jgi:glycosyltransferase involved in cell wall biosynthesis
MVAVRRVYTATRYPDDGGARARVRILMVCPRFAPDVGGVEAHVYEVARRLVPRGVEVEVLTVDRTRLLPAADCLEGVRIRRVGAWPGRTDYGVAPGIVGEVQRTRCDVMHLHSHHTFVAPIAMAAAARRGLPFVVTFHGIGHLTSLRGALRPAQVSMMRPLLARASRLVALTDAERERFRLLLRLPVQRFVVVPNGGDRLVGAARDVSPRCPSRLIVSIGRLERFKGHHRLVAALPAVLQRYPDVRLLIVGSGPEEHTLHSLASSLGVAERVDITAVPFADRRRMAALVLGAQVVALLSEGEGQPLAVLEAAALGRPLLVSYAPGLRQLVDDGLAAGVSLHASPEDVAAALIRQLLEPLIPRTSCVPTWAACVDALLQIYASVLRPNAAAV